MMIQKPFSKSGIPDYQTEIVIPAIYAYFQHLSTSSILILPVQIPLCKVMYTWWQFLVFRVQKHSNETKNLTLLDRKGGNTIRENVTFTVLKANAGQRQYNDWRLLCLKLTEDKERMPGSQKHQDSSQEVFADDIVLDVVGVVLNAEWQQLQDQAQELGSLVVICIILKKNSQGRCYDSFSFANFLKWPKCFCNFRKFKAILCDTPSHCKTSSARVLKWQHSFQRFEKFQCSAGQLQTIFQNSYFCVCELLTWSIYCTE